MRTRDRSMGRGARAAIAAMLGLILIGTALPAPVLAVGDILEVHRPKFADLDGRTGRVRPTSAQRERVATLKAHAVWNRFGTPASLIRFGGYLTTGLAGKDAPTAARTWVDRNRSLFRLSSVTTSTLELLNDSPMVGSNGHAVIFRQRFGSLPAGQDGLITVGIVGTARAGWKVAYVSSSSAGTQAAPLAATISASDAWIKAARNVGRTVATGDITGLRDANGWKVFRVKGVSELARARLVALPRPGNTVRAAWETWLIDVDGGRSEAYRHFVDARDGKILLRSNQVFQLADEHEGTEAVAPAAPSTAVFTGTYADDTGNPAPDPAKQKCTTTPAGGHGPYTAPPGTESITVVAAAAVSSNDIVIELFFNVRPTSDPANTTGRVATGDLVTSPETLEYDGSPNAQVPAGDYFVRICPFTPPTAPPVPPYDYAGNITISDEDADTAFPFPPKWRYFRSNPRVDLSDADVRKTGCFIPGILPSGCQFSVFSQAARAPWDHNVSTNTPSFTTTGNQAYTSEAWGSPLTPAEQYRPVSLEREYVYPFGNRWNKSKCSPTEFVPGVGNDINASIVSLFANHNRVHDWSYFLGFTERNFNMQVNNFGLTSPRRENDPEIGNAQAGAVSGGAPTFLGRDNANQIPTPDGVPGITNMYLWQPLPAAFYAPCVDGDFDMSVIAHEYGHQIQHRMIAGPDAGIASDQGRQMGESWSDLTAIEYLAEYNYYNDINPPAGLNRFAVGPYVTGSLQKGIRNYGMNMSPLNFSNLDYDPNGIARVSPHANGEIWSAANFDIRQALTRKYDASFPSSNATLQRQCADGERPVTQCPGNRRWFQILMDAFLLQPSETNMVIARNAYLGADVMRFGGANQRELWDAFARRGLGQDADSDGGNDVDPTPSFRSPLRTTAQQATIRFRTIATPGETGTPKATVYVGDYEARAVPIADTRGDDNNPDTPEFSNIATFVPGTYRFVVVAPGYGHFRFTRTLAADSAIHNINVAMPRNWASRADLNGGAFDGGAIIAGDGRNKNKLIDDTEATNWAVLAGDLPTGATNVNGSDITVDLAGSAPRLVNSVRVSALLRPQASDDQGDDPTEDPAPVGDTENQSRFSALRSFAIETCNQQAKDCKNPANYTRIYTSPANAFPGGQPRPLAPDLLLRQFDVPNTMATHVRLVALTNQCTGGPVYQGDQDLDPLNNSDCQTGSSQDMRLRASELQVISQGGAVTEVRDPVVVVTMSAPATAATNTRYDYTINYTNLGPEAASNPTITDVLPAGVEFVSASGGLSRIYDADNRRVTWKLATVPAATGGSVGLRVRTIGPVGTVITNVAEFSAPLTIANPGVAVTTIIAPL
jgi:extracellular elastinolytic metalloproteinase